MSVRALVLIAVAATASAGLLQAVGDTVSALYRVAVIVPTSIRAAGASCFVIARRGLLRLLVDLGIIATAVREAPVAASAGRMSAA